MKSTARIVTDSELAPSRYSHADVSFDVRAAKVVPRHNMSNKVADVLNPFDMSNLLDSLKSVSEKSICWNEYRNKKWTHSFFYALLKICVTNSWIYYCNLHEKSSYSSTDFLEDLLKLMYDELFPVDKPTESVVHKLESASKIGKCSYCKVKQQE